MSFLRLYERFSGSVAGGEVGIERLTPPSTSAFLRAFDGVLDFIALEKHLLVRDINLLGKGSLLRTFPATFKVMTFIVAHSYLWWVTSRIVPCSYLTFTSGGFLIWHSFQQSNRAAAPKSLRGHTTRNINVKWANLLIAGLLWGVFQVVCGVYLIGAFYSIFMKHSVIAWTVDFPDITRLFPVLLINSSMGLGFGLIVQAATKKWEAAEYVAEMFFWLVYVTSGVFESYASLPNIIQQYIWFNPEAAPMEFSRQAFDPLYPVANLTMIYPMGIALVVLIVGFSFHGEYRKERAA